MKRTTWFAGPVMVLATAPGVTAIPPGQWVFRYPAGAMALLQPPA